MFNLCFVLCLAVKLIVLIKNKELLHKQMRNLCKQYFIYAF